MVGWEGGTNGSWGRKSLTYVNDGAEARVGGFEALKGMTVGCLLWWDIGLEFPDGFGHLFRGG